MTAMREETSEASAPSWLAPARQQLQTVTTPVSTELEDLRRDPSRLALLARQQPAQMPRLLQHANQVDPTFALVVQAAMAREFRASAGYGEGANAMLRAALDLDGEGADVVRADFRELVRIRDDESQPPRLPGTGPKTSVQSEVLDRASADPEFGHLYAAFADDPSKAAAILSEHAQRDPSTLSARSSDLHSMMTQSPRATKAFVDAVMQLHGPHATLVRTLVAREVHEAMAEDVKGVIAVDTVANGMKTPQHVRVERLIPLLAELVSSPDVANALIKFDMRAERRPPGMPTLRTFLDEMLRASYSRAALLDVHNTLSQGGAEMLKKSLEARDPAQQREWEETAGTFLGTAASSEATVGLEEDVASEVSKTLNDLGKWTPGTAGKVEKIAGALVGLAPKHHQDFEWTQSVVDQLLQIVYAEARPRPVGEIDDPGVKEWDNGFMDWRRGTAQAFENSSGVAHGK